MPRSPKNARDLAVTLILTSDLLTAEYNQFVFVSNCTDIVNLKQIAIKQALIVNFGLKHFSHFTTESCMFLVCWCQISWYSNHPERVR